MVRIAMGAFTLFISIVVFALWLFLIQKYAGKIYSWVSKYINNFKV